MFFEILLIILGTLGLATAMYIPYKKRSQKVFVCLPGQDCNRVLHSKYNKFFGFPNEYLGILYYSIVVLGGFFLIYTIELFSFITTFQILFIGGLLSTLFSLYFVFIMWRVLKEWCHYCLVSAFASISIFITEIVWIFLS